jgi:hypothetical protein
VKKAVAFVPARQNLSCNASQECRMQARRRPPPHDKKEEAEQEHPFVLFLTSLLCFNTSFIQAVFRYNNK